MAKREQRPERIASFDKVMRGLIAVMPKELAIEQAKYDRKKAERKERKR